MFLGRRSTPLLFIAVLSIAAPVFVTTPAVAQNELAVTHYKAGKAYYAQGRYDDAIREFKEAYRLSKKADLHYNIGQAYERAGKLSEAISFYQRYLDESKAKDPILREKIANLRARIQKTAISVNANVAGAKVVIDGKVAGQTPLAKPLAVKAGVHEVRVQKAGYQAYVIRVAVSVGAIVDVKADLVATGQSVPHHGGPAVTPPPTKTPPTEATPGTGHRGRLWTWVSLGVAGVALGVAAGTGVAALGKAGDAKTSGDTDADSARTLALVSDITLGVGLAAAVAGVVLYFIEGKGHAESPDASGTALRVTPTFGPTFSGISADLRF